MARDRKTRDRKTRDENDLIHDPHDYQDPDRVGINPESETSGETMEKDVDAGRRMPEDSVAEHAERTHDREAKLAKVDPDYRISPSSQSREEAQKANEARGTTHPKPNPAIDQDRK